MKSSLKRSLVAVGCAALLGFMVFGRDMVSYCTTATSMVQTSVKNAVPLEFEIERARKLVKELVPDIRKNVELIAHEEVEVAKLEKEIAEKSANLDKSKEKILTLRNDLQGNATNVSFSYSGKQYSRKQIESDLENRFIRFQAQEGTLATVEKMLEVRRHSLDAAKQKLEAYQQQKRNLELEIANIDARLKLVDVAKASSAYNFDSGSLGKAKQVVADLRTRLETEEQLASVSDDLQSDVIIGDAKDLGNKAIAEQVTEYFEPSPAKATVANSK